MKKIFVVFIIVLLKIHSISAQDFTTEGKDFWLAFGQNFKSETIITELYHTVSLRVRFVATADGTVSFTFTQTGSNEGIEDMAVEAGKMYVVELTSDQAGLVYSNRPRSGISVGANYTNTNNKSLHIQSTAPISLYAMNFCNYVADATNIIPTQSLGTNYYHISYTPLAVGSAYYDDSGYDGYLVVATEDNTNVYEGRGSTTPVKTLNKGQVYYRYEKKDMTGRYVWSDKPVAYYVAETSAQVPAGSAAADNLYQQLLPLSAWGTEFLVPNTTRAKDRIRIVASMDNTTITISGATRVGGNNGSGNVLNEGQYIELELDKSTNSTGCHISSGTNPIAVTAYLVGNQYLGETGNANAGDPAMVWIPPLKQNVKSTTIAPFKINEVIGHNAIIIVRNQSIEGTKVIKEDTGEVISINSDSWVSNHGYSFCDLPLGADAASAYTFSNDDGLIVLMYGYGNSVSYYYLAGSSVHMLNPHFLVNGMHHQEVNGTQFCEGDFTFDGEIFSLKSPSVPENIRWFINGAEETAQQGNQNPWTKFLAEGTYTIRMEVINSYGLTDICTTTFTVINCKPVWIGGGRWEDPDGTIINDENKNRWSLAENWLNKIMPTANNRVEYHPLAIDLHADSDGKNERLNIYEVKGIDNATTANLIIPADCALKITDVNSFINFTSTAKVYVKSGKPETVGGDLQKNGSLILPQDVYTEKVLVELYVHSPSPFGEKDGDKLTWQYFGIPLIGFLPKQMHGAFVRYYDSNAGSDDPSQNDLIFWHNVTNDSPAFDLGKGYEIAVWEGNTQTYLLDGLLLTYDWPIPLRNSSTAQNKYFAGQNVVANPYTAGLDVATGIDFGTGLQNTAYIFNSGTIGQWDDKINDQLGTAVGQYLAVPSLTAGNGYLIPSLQGFVVKFDQNLTQNPSAPEFATLSFKYAGVAKNNQAQRSAQKKKQVKTTISLYSGKELKDRMWLYTDKDATYGFDNGYDGEKWFSSNKLSQLYTRRDDGIYQVDAVPDINNTQIMFKPEEGVEDHTLVFCHDNMDELYEKIYLIDLFNKVTIDITAGNSQYSFTTDKTSAAENRFMIISNKNDKMVNDDNQFEVFHNSDAIIFYNRSNEPANCSIYNTSGQIIHSFSIDGSDPVCLNRPLLSGIYLVEAVFPSHKVTKKFIIH